MYIYVYRYIYIYIYITGQIGEATRVMCVCTQGAAMISFGAVLGKCSPTQVSHCTAAPAPAPKASPFQLHTTAAHLPAEKPSCQLQPRGC